jgi:alpha-tubulin suppressor-like RCC1 family protein
MPVDRFGVLLGVFVSDISSSTRFTAALGNNGRVYMFGFNANGYLGGMNCSLFNIVDNTLITRASPSAVYTGGVLNGKYVISVACSTDGTLAVTSDGGVSNNHHINSIGL